MSRLELFGRIRRIIPDDRQYLLVSRTRYMEDSCSSQRVCVSLRQRRPDLQRIADVLIACGFTGLAAGYAIGVVGDAVSA